MPGTAMRSGTCSRVCQRSYSSRRAGSRPFHSASIPVPAKSSIVGSVSAGVRPLGSDTYLDTPLPAVSVQTEVAPARRKGQRALGEDTMGESMIHGWQRLLAAASVLAALALVPAKAADVAPLNPPVDV